MMANSFPRITVRLRSFAMPAALLALALTSSACGDRRLGKLSAGISRDSVNTIMAGEPHRVENYLTEGKLWDVLYYARAGTSTADSIEWRKLSPVILADGVLVGWGWSFWDVEAARLKIQVPPKN